MAIVRSTSFDRKDKSVRREHGASQNKTSMVDKFASYRSHHLYVARESLMRLLRAPVGSLMTWLVIGIALALPAGFYVVLGNIDAIGRGWNGNAQISLFLHQAVREKAARTLSDQIQQRVDVSATQFISREDALREFQQLSGYGDVMESLSHNPLPPVIVVKTRLSKKSTQQAERLMQDLQRLPEVAIAQLDLAWLQRLYAMMRLGQRLVAVVAILLALGVLLAIGNTIRLAIENRRDEILVVKLVGGTDAFVRRPFLYTGFWYGLGGGVVAWLIITAALALMGGVVAELASLYGSQYQLLGLNLLDTIGLWFTGMTIGLLGAWLAVMRHLWEIQPV